MKNIHCLAVLLFLAAVLRASAAFVSAQFDPNNALPIFPESLVFDGITHGTVIVAVSISAEGKISDALVLGYSQEALARTCLAALKQWKAKPARFDGDPVPTQMDLKFNFTRNGVVQSINLTTAYLNDLFDGLGGGRLTHNLCSREVLDRVPARVTSLEPQYATQAEKQGVRGRVSVRFYIDETGAVRLPSVSSPDQPYLADAALTAVRGWRFEPPTHRGKPVLIAATQEFNFGHVQ
jgi:TonB family protein